MNQQTNKLVLVKRLKGWLALMMAVTMLFGSSMTVLAADTPETKNLRADYDESGFYVDGISVGDTLSAGDSIEYIPERGSGGFENVILIIDENQVEDSNWSWNNSINRCTYTFGKDVKVTGTSVSNELVATITFATMANSNESSGGSGTDSGSASQENTGEEPKAEEPKETEEQIFTKELLASVANVKPGDAKAIDATIWHSFSANVLKELLSKEGVSYTLYYNYGGECFYITIPAGAALEEGCEWYGPLKLSAMFGRTIIDKKDLHAAINK